MVWKYVDRWLKEMVEVERPNRIVETYDIEDNWWNRMWRWWREYDLPIYEKKSKWF